MTYRCAWCGDEDTGPNSVWDHRAARATRALPLVSHGICHACLALVYEELGWALDDLAGDTAKGWPAPVAPR